MRILVYATTRRITRSILGVRLVADVDADQEPEDSDYFAAQYEGDFIDIPSGERDCEVQHD